MQNIPIELAEPEMILAREVRRADNINGPPVCGKGVVLTLSLLERLKSIGIKNLCVEGHPVSMEGDMTLAEQMESLERRFVKVGDDPLMMKLKEIYRNQIVRSMGMPDE